MIEITIKDEVLAQAAGEGMDAFVEAVAVAIDSAIGGNQEYGYGVGLTAETMAQLNTSQITLLAYMILREEVMDGGFVELIHDGYGGFIFKNPFARILKSWGLVDLGRMLQHAHKMYSKYHEQLEQDMTDDEFMATYEQCPEFDDFDDEFVLGEERFTEQIAAYIDDHLEDFVKVV